MSTHKSKINLANYIQLNQGKPDDNDTTNNFSYLKQTESESEIEVFNMNSVSNHKSTVEHNSSGQLMQTIK